MGVPNKVGRDPGGWGEVGVGGVCGGGGGGWGGLLGARMCAARRGSVFSKTEI